MADFHGPYLLDPFQLVIHVNFPKKPRVRYVAFTLEFERLATHNFQLTHFSDQANDWVRGARANPDDPVVDTGDYWDVRVTRVRYIWRSFLPLVKEGWNGTSWANITYRSDRKVGDLYELDPTKGAWEPASSGFEYVGLPDFGEGFDAPTGIAAAIGEGAIYFAPQLEWVDPAEDGGEALFDDDDDFTGPITAPIGTTFRQTSSVFCRLHGVHCEDSGTKRSGGSEFRQFATEVEVGFVPEGGPVTPSGEYPETYFGLDRTSGITVRRSWREGGKTVTGTYFQFGAVHEAQETPLPTPLCLPGPGRMWVLCKLDEASVE